MSSGAELHEPGVEILESSNDDTEEFMDASGNSEEESLVFRPDVVSIVINRLAADAQRGAGCLQRSDINRTLLRKKLSFAECIAVEEQLQTAGYRINDEDDDNSELSPPTLALRRHATYLTESDERDLGRKIQLSLSLPGNTSGLSSDYVDRIRRDADKARGRFVVSNLKYVTRLAHRLLPCQHLSLDDLIQEGVLGLMRAADLYDPERGFRFKTYATWWIEQHMRRAIADKERTVRLPVHVQEKITRIRRSDAKLSLILGHRPTPDELAAAVGMETEKLMTLLWHAQATDCVDGDTPVGDETTLFELVEDSHATPLESAIDRELEERIQQVLASLPHREQVIIRMRFGIGLDRAYTLESIGQKHGITRERIRQVEAKALGRLRHPARRKRLQGFLE